MRSSVRYGTIERETLRDHGRNFEPRNSGLRQLPGAVMPRLCRPLMFYSRGV